MQLLHSAGRLLPIVGTIFALASLCCTAARAADARPIEFSNCANAMLPRNPDPLDRAVLKQLSAQHVPGAALVVVTGHKLQKVRTYGFADMESCTPATDRTAFGIGSISKQLTAAAALTLVRDGLLSLDQPIGRWFPEAAGKWDGITVRHLLTHTSGIPDYAGDDRKYPEIDLDHSWNPATPELIGKIAAAPLNFRPGEDWAYSNTGYLVLSVLLERAAKMPFPKLMKERLFQPLGMNDTWLGDEGGMRVERATGYLVRKDGLQHGWSMSAAFSRSGDMCILSSARDMGRWLVALGRDPILPARLWREMLTPVRLNDGTLYPYGFGMFVDQIGDQPRWFHAGSWIAGYTAMLQRFPEQGIGVVAMTNAFGAGLPAAGLVEEALSQTSPELVASNARIQIDPQPKLTAALLNLLKGDDVAAGAAAMTSAFARHDQTHGAIAQAAAAPASSAALHFVRCTRVSGRPASALGTAAERQCAYRLSGIPGAPVEGLIFWLTAHNEVAGLSLW